MPQEVTAGVTSLDSSSAGDVGAPGARSASPTVGIEARENRSEIRLANDLRA
jgi:hypothetical protein